MARKRKNIISTVDTNIKSVDVDDQHFTQISSIDQLWGIKVNKYKEKNLEDYLKKLDQMSGIELQNHAFEFGVSAESDREVIINKLTRLFKSDLLSKTKNSSNITVISQETNQKISEIFGGKL